MNKKRLSVVMAGAMLASAVAPVLAAEVQKNELSAAYLGELQEELRTLVESKKFAADEKDTNLRGKSVYAIYVNDKNTGLDVNSTQDQWQDVFNAIKAEDTVKVWSKGFKEVDGKYYHTEVVKEYEKYKEVSELTAIKTTLAYPKYGKLIKSATLETLEGQEKLVIEFLGDIGDNGDEYGNTMTIGIGDAKVDVSKYYDADGNEVVFPGAGVGQADKLVRPGQFYGFVLEPKKEIDVKAKAELVREISITPGGNNLTVEELYDGLMLTEKGHDFFTTLKEAKAMERVVTLKGNKTDENNKGLVITESNVADAIKMYSNKARFTVTISSKGNMPEEVYTITGANEANTERLAKWMLKPLARVDILAGSNRYETAVEIAKEYAGLTGPAATYANETVKNVVLVNGNALVDGLAAAPLAASKTNQVYNTETTSWENVSAPILLTEAYLKELMADHLVGGKETAKIHLVGGETVLSKSLERELKALGFEVVRYNGDNREETSLSVAKEIGLDEAFVVGAEGEADAMSIASVAATTKTPIVVAKKGGITEDATYELRKSDVTVIGGENAVSKADYNAIKAEAEGITRVAGSNRKATNALIISKYYKRNYVGMAKNVIVAKDGQRNKTELVDALAAANLASEKQAPVVLATDSLSREQLNALALNAKESYALYQVGIGVNKENVVKVIATHLGLTNR